eukprot:7448485-Pyramimonas_sp.AAC.1
MGSASASDAVTRGPRGVHRSNLSTPWPEAPQREGRGRKGRRRVPGLLGSAQARLQRRDHLGQALRRDQGGRRVQAE